MADVIAALGLMSGTSLDGHRRGNIQDDGEAGVEPGPARLLALQPRLFQPKRLVGAAMSSRRRLRTATFIESLDRAKDEACNSRDCSGAGGFVLGLANESLVEDVAPIACV